MINHELLAQNIGEFFMRIFLPQKKPLPAQKEGIKVIAHRGLFENCPENSLEGFAACAGAGAWGVELDIRWTKDMVPVVYHDEAIICPKNHAYPIEQLAYSELLAYKANIPSLAEVIDKISPKCHLMIELKDNLGKQQQNILQQLLSHLTFEKVY